MRCVFASPRKKNREKAKVTNKEEKKEKKEKRKQIGKLLVKWLA